MNTLEEVATDLHQKTGAPLEVCREIIKLTLVAMDETSREYKGTSGCTDATARSTVLHAMLTARWE